MLLITVPNIKKIPSLRKFNVSFTKSLTVCKGVLITSWILYFLQNLSYYLFLPYFFFPFTFCLIRAFFSFFQFHLPLLLFWSCDDALVQWTSFWLVLCKLLSDWLAGCSSNGHTIKPFFTLSTDFTSWSKWNTCGYCYSLFIINVE